jgi:hypothetical protein
MQSRALELEAHMCCLDAVRRRGEWAILKLVALQHEQDTAEAAASHKEAEEPTAPGASSSPSPSPSAQERRQKCKCKKENQLV